MSDLPFDPLAEARRQYEARGYGSLDCMEAVTALNRAQQILKERLDEVLAPFGLTAARYEVLAVVCFSSDQALPMSTVAARLMVHAASVTYAIGQLEERDLVVRRIDADDGRRVLATATAEGLDVMAKATEALVSHRFGLDGVEDREAHRLARTVDGLRLSAGDVTEETLGKVADGAMASRSNSQNPVRRLAESVSHSPR
jgi:DNA-binding MarR family transcriptional regulator